MSDNPPCDRILRWAMFIIAVFVSFFQCTLHVKAALSSTGPISSQQRSSSELALGRVMHRPRLDFTRCCRRLRGQFGGRPAVRLPRLVSLVGYLFFSISLFLYVGYMFLYVGYLCFSMLSLPVGVSAGSVRGVPVPLCLCVGVSMSATPVCGRLCLLPLSVGVSVSATPVCGRLYVSPCVSGSPELSPCTSCQPSSVDVTYTCSSS